MSLKQLTRITKSHILRGVKRRYESLASYFEATDRTQDWLASELGVDRSYVSLLVSGKRQPSLPLALKIEKLTGVPVERMVAA